MEIQLLSSVVGTTSRRPLLNQNTLTELGGEIFEKLKRTRRVAVKGEAGVAHD